MELTIFELHLDDASFAANAPFAGTEEDASEQEWGEAKEQDEGDGGGPSPVAFVVGLVFLVGIALAVRRKLRGSDESGDVMDESTADAVTA